jgi:ankyrin repeat protein
MPSKYATSGSAAYKEAAPSGTLITSEQSRAKNSTIKPYFADIVAGEPSQVVKDTQLVEAAVYGDTDRVRRLITQGANVTTAENSPLRLAAANGHADCVQVLVASGANPVDREALIRAAKGGYADVVDLLARDADPVALDVALQLASERHHQNTGVFGARCDSPKNGHARTIEILKAANLKAS